MLIYINNYELISYYIFHFHKFSHKKIIIKFIVIVR